MNIFDFYFRQIVTQSVLDWAFAQAQLSDHDIVADTVLTGILDGLSVSENHLGADLSVDIVQGVAYSEEGARIFEAEPLTNLDCSVDEYGVSTAVGSAGNERWLSIFARFTRDLQEPAIDGNALQVYTKQFEDCEIVVHQGAEALIYSAVKPAIIDNAVLLADVDLQYGQTTIQTALHINADRRQDWMRVPGTTLPDFVYGNPHDAIEHLFQLVDGWAGSGSPFAFTDDWYGGDPVLGTAPPITSVAEALNAIIYDLALASGVFTGAERVGVGGYTTPNAYVTWPNTQIQAAMEVIADIIDGHINGNPPQHPASSITTVADVTQLMRCDLVTYKSAGTTLTNEQGGQCEVVEWMSLRHIRCRNITGTWSAGDGVDTGGTYVAPEFYYMGFATDDFYINGAALQAELELIAAAINSRPDLKENERITGKWNFEEGATFNGPIHATSIVGGTFQNLPLETLINTLGSSTIVQSLAYEFEETLSTTNNNDICRGIKYDHGAYKNPRPCVYVSGYDDNIVSQLWIEDDDDDINETTVTIRIDGVGTILPSGDNVAAIACGGDKLYILVDDNGSGTNSYLVCLDMRRGGEWLWTYSLSGYSCGTQPYDRTRMVANGSYVWMILGGEAAEGTPLVRINAAGTLLSNGNGDWGSITGYVPSGGFAVTESSIWFAIDNGTNTYLVPASTSCGALGWGYNQIATDGRRCRDIVAPGRFVVAPLDTDSATTTAQVYIKDHVGTASGYNLVLQKVRSGNYPVRVTFDGHYLWFKAIGHYTGQTSGESRQCVFPYHLSRIQPIPVDIDEPRFFVAEPDAGSSSTTVGMVLAWGPGLWHLPSIGTQNMIRLQAATGLIVS